MINNVELVNPVQKIDVQLEVIHIQLTKFDWF